jgi:carboxymethylenebutenolidase
MCYETSARPPLPPIQGGAGGVQEREIVLTAADGNRFAGFSATTASPGGPGMVILPDVRGLHPFYRDLAVRFAEAGIHGTAFDYFGRTAGLDERGEDFDYMSHIERTRPDTIAQDVAATVAHVESPEGGGADAVFTVGFCFGGRQSFNQAARQRGLAGVIGFYGRVGERDRGDREAPVHHVKDYTCPVLGLFGGADPAIPPEHMAAFRRALDEAGVRNEIVAYEGAPHSFFDRTYEQYRKECDDAWARILRFVQAEGSSG